MRALLETLEPELLAGEARLAAVLDISGPRAEAGPVALNLRIDAGILAVRERGAILAANPAVSLGFVF